MSGYRYGDIVEIWISDKSLSIKHYSKGMLVNEIIHDVPVCTKEKTTKTLLDYTNMLIGQNCCMDKHPVEEVYFSHIT